MAQMLRVTSDVWDEAHGIDECFDAWRKWTGKQSDNFWIDMDMIPFGQLLLMSPKIELGGENNERAIRLAGQGYRRWSRFSHDQMFTFITLRALAASPLMVGGDLPTMDAFSLHLITDPDMLACDQNGVMGRPVSARDGIEVWMTQERNQPDRGWIGVFNRTDQVKRVTLTKSFLGLTKDSTLSNIWMGHKKYELNASSMMAVDINPDGVLFLRFE